MPGPGRMPWAPPTLLQIEDRAESAADAALAGDGARAAQAAEEAVRLWPSVRAAAAERAVDPALLRRIDGLVRELGASAADVRPGGLLPLAEKANGLAAYAAGLMNLFSMTVPAALPALDAQARAAAIAGRLGEWKAAEAHAAALDAAMLAFFPTARTKAPDDLPELERRLDALADDVAQKDAAALATDARRFIAAVEALRRTYVNGK
ncbi:MAG: hypothetical protein IRZ11_01625 [Clostridia bacterium]|nr:hypothetical protein [Clostridia bacterium]